MMLSRYREAGELEVCHDKVWTNEKGKQNKKFPLWKAKTVLNTARYRAQKATYVVINALISFTSMKKQKVAQLTHADVWKRCFV